MGGASVFRLGDLDLTPVMTMLRYERGHVYPGGGAAYVLAGDLVTDDGRVEIGNEVAPVIGGGLTFGGSGRVGFVIDVRYIPLSISGRPSAGEGRIKADVDPLLASAGMRIRF